MNLRNLKIGVRLGAGFATLLLLLSIVAVMGAIEVRLTNQHVEFFAVNIVLGLLALASVYWTGTAVQIATLAVGGALVAALLYSFASGRKAA